MGMPSWPFPDIPSERFADLTPDELETLEALTLTFIAQMERMRMAETQSAHED
ncbi:hypothetical protein AVE30378_01527 [Achromobacter veterisilvae]|uniref:Uncharacterized protein n=1 Tax=Achromobacter veterisilvae TaxID=2069367 RepID=A0A446CBY1_9BURK|nr:hypothetical protein AVE30378_01527 [Achromobacter veterisilvae]